MVLIICHISTKRGAQTSARQMYSCSYLDTPSAPAICIQGAMTRPDFPDFRPFEPRYLTVQGAKDTGRQRISLFCLLTGLLHTVCPIYRAPVTTKTPPNRER